MTTSVYETLKQGYFDTYGEPIFHEIDGLRYWGKARQAEALGLEPEPMNWSQTEIDAAIRTAFNRRTRAAELMDAAKAVESEAEAEISMETGTGRGRD